MLRVQIWQMLADICVPSGGFLTTLATTARARTRLARFCRLCQLETAPCPQTSGVGGQEVRHAIASARVQLPLTVLRSTQHRLSFHAVEHALCLQTSVRFPSSIQNSASRFPSVSLSFAFVDTNIFVIYYTYELWPIPSKSHTQI